MTTPGEEPDNWVPELTFGARLALVRHRMGWNIKEAAAACGLPAQSWRGWELEGREPHRKDTIAMTIATRTNVDFLWLTHGPDRGAQRIPSGRYGRTRVLARKSGTVQPSTPEPISQPRTPLVHIRPVRQVPTNVGQSRRPVGAGVL